MSTLKQLIKNKIVMHKCERDCIGGHVKLLGVYPGKRTYASVYVKSKFSVKAKQYAHINRYYPKRKWGRSKHGN